MSFANGGAVGISPWMDDLNTRLSANELLAELGWLRRLARSLVGGVSAEEDLVQETWLAAARVQGGVSRPWLVGTLRRLAARWHRSESRQRRREGLVARSEAVDTDSLLERNELLGLLLGEMRRIDEPFRTALILLYQEGMTVRDAAARLDIPQDTLRWRRREGLQRLRSQLDRGTSIDWRASLVPLIGPHTLELTTAGVAVAAATKTMTLMGGILMTWKWTLAVVLICVTALFVAGGNDSELEPLQDLRAEALDSPRVQQAPNLDEPLAQEERRHAVVPEAGIAAAQPAAVPASPQPSTGPTLVVTATDHRSQPIEGARIWIGDTSDPVDAFWVTDADGLAVLPLPEVGHTTLSGMTDSLYGSKPISTKATGGEARLRLFPDADVSVLIVDQDGVPIPDVPVALIVKQRLEHTGSELPRDMLAFQRQVQTDASGLAVVRHVAYALLSRGGLDKYWVGPAVLLAQRSDVMMVEGELPTKQVRIVLPPVEPLDVRVLDRNGALNLNASKVRVLINPAPGLPRDVPDLVEEARFSSLGIVDVELIHGVGRLPMIGLGLKLLAEARDVESTRSTFGLGAGPVRVGVGAMLRLEPQDVGMWITGVARDAEGLPLGNQKLSGSIKLARKVVFQSLDFEVLSDAVGGFRIHIDEDLRIEWDAAVGRTLSLTRLGNSPDVMSEALSPVPAHLLLGDNDVGILTLERRIPLLAGHATTQEGEPVDLGWITVRVKSEFTSRYRRRIVGLRRIIQPGSFAIYGDSIDLDPEFSEVLEIGLDSKGLPGLARVVTQGELDLRFVFDEPGFLSGRVLLTPEDRYQDYWVRFNSKDATGKREDSLPGTLASNGRFALKDLRLRGGDIEVRDIATNTLLALVQGVTPSPAPDGVEPRLAGIDLQAKVHEYSLTVTNAEGNGIEAAHFDSPFLPGRGASFGSGRFHWRAAVDSIEGRLSAPGYLSQTLNLIPGVIEHVVILERGPKVLVRPVPAITLSGGATVQVRLAGGDTYEEVQLRALGDGSYVGFVSGPGRYLVRGLILKRGKQLVELPLSREPVASILVTGSATGQSFDVAFDMNNFEASVGSK